MKKLQKILFFTEYYYPAQNTTSYYLTDIIRTAASVWQGDIKIYTASDLGNNKEILQQDNVSVKRFSSGNLNKNSLLIRLCKFCLMSLQFAWNALWNVSSGDTVFTVTNPAFMLVFFALFRKVKKFNYILLVYDIFPEVLIPAGLTSPNSFMYRLTLQIYNWAYRQVDELIVIGRDMKEVVEQKVGKSSNITLLTNWVDVKNIFPETGSENEILKDLHLTNKRIFSLAGNMGRTQGLENLLKGIEILPSDEKIHFLLMGDGAYGKNIEHFISAHPQINLTYTGRIKKEQQSAMLNAGDIAIISLDSNMYGLSVPSKSYFNMAAGKPLLLIAEENSEIAIMIKEHKLGWVVPPGDPDGLAQTIQKISLLSDDELTNYGQRSRKIAEDYYSAEKVLEKYKELFKQYSF